MDTEISRQVIRNQGEIANLREDFKELKTEVKTDVKEIKSDVSIIKTYIIERKAEQKVGYAVVAAITAIGAYVLQWVPSLMSYLKTKGL